LTKKKRGRKAEQGYQGVWALGPHSPSVVGKQHFEEVVRQKNKTSGGGEKKGGFFNKKIR